MSETKRARCPVCDRTVGVTPRGRLRAHGNRAHPSWEKCYALSQEQDARAWSPGPDGVLVAPEHLRERLWDVRAVVEHWAPEHLTRAQISRLTALLRGHWDELAQELDKTRRENRILAVRARNTRALDAQTVYQLVAPVVAQEVEGYAPAEQIARAATEALMGWLESVDGA